MRNEGKREAVSGRAASPGYRADVAEVLGRLFAKRSEVNRRKMFGFPAFYTAGRLFACVYGDGVGLKLPQERIQELKGKPGIAPFQPYGRPKMKEWIQIRYDRIEAYATVFQESIRFVGRAGTGPGKSRPVRGPKRRP